MMMMMMMRPDLMAAQVGVNYDPMIAKVIARGADRNTALARLHTALSDLQVRLCSAPDVPVVLLSRI